SANLPGRPPAPGPEAILRDFAAAAEAGTLVVLDGGVLGNSPPSTVVDCTRPTPRLVREGALTLVDLRRAAGRLAPCMKTILLVCTGNICRSPLAAALLERALKERGFEAIEVS